MENKKKFKHPKVMRDYWAECQRRHRAKKKDREKKETPK